MVVQALLESLSRCFGAPGPNMTGRKSNYESSMNKPTQDGDSDGSRRQIEGDTENEVADMRRRQGRAKGLELQDEEWDNLFSRDSEHIANNNTSPHQNDSKIDKINNTGNNSVASSSRSQSTPSRIYTPIRKILDKEITYPEAYAKVQEAADHRASSAKRRREKKKDIFRDRRNAQNTSLASRLLGKDGVKALCFANPVHTGGVELVEDEASACQTLDTADDTTISHMYTENQCSTEPKGPMPLFNHFKVNCNGYSKDTLMDILNSGSHHSARARHLFVEEMEPTQNINEIFSNSSHPPESTTLTDIQFSPVQKTDALQSINNYKQTIEYSGAPRISYHGSNSNVCTLESRDSAMLRRPPKPSGSDDFPPPVQKISGSNSTSMSSTYI